MKGQVPVSVERENRREGLGIPNILAMVGQCVACDQSRWHIGSASMSELNQTLFLLINASAHPPAWLIVCAAALADTPPMVAPLLVVALWVWGRPERRGALIAVSCAVIVAQGVNLALGLIWFDPRPFMVPTGNTLVAHAADNGFPSDHVTLLWTLGLGLWLAGRAPRWGGAVCFYGLAVAWARIWLGIHSPEDILGSATVGIVMGLGARAITPAVERSLLGVADRLYERAIRKVGVPTKLVPQRLLGHITERS